MQNGFTPLSSLTGQSFRDNAGQRWWVRGPRPGSTEQFVVEVEVRSHYPRVDLYALTESEFVDRARAAELMPERASN
jgi:hypothetical protein